MDKKFIYLFFVFAILCLSSCHTTKRVSDYDDIYPQEHVENVESSEIHQEIETSAYDYLSEKLGVHVSSKDNIQLYETVARWLRTPYKYGGNTRNGVDCSGFVCNIYKSVFNKKLYRRSIDIFYKNCKKISKKNLREGDLVFFATGKNKNKINHVGIYLKNGKFIHASSSKGVVVSDLDNPYYRRNYFTSGRVN